MRSFLKVYFIDNVIRVVLTCPPCLPLPSASHSLRQSPHHCSRPWVVHRSSLASPFPTALYTPTGSSVTAYLFLISSPLPPFCPFPLTAGNLPVTNFFSLAAFKSSSFSLTFGFVTMMCLGVGLFASIIIGTLCASWTCMSIPFTNLGKLSFTVFSERFLFSCSFSCLSGTPMRQMLDLLKVFQGMLTVSSGFLDSFFLLVVLIG